MYVASVTSPDPLAAGDVLRIEADGFKCLVGTQRVHQGRGDWLADVPALQRGAVVANHRLRDVRAT